MTFLHAIHMMHDDMLRNTDVPYCKTKRVLAFQSHLCSIISKFNANS